MLITFCGYPILEIRFLPRWRRTSTVRIQQRLAGPLGSPRRDEEAEKVASALMNLGTRRTEAARLARMARESLGPAAGFEELIRGALR